ncbi:unnamed protein product [Cylicocyclus nassatus]|uniref:Sugar phosphate transporter domain-containing protein n=1 Tax=Cylicocyclus nassatus TaxID=53992 RepID=A0AA36H9F6_CYLNA|nr:unnamed protein product [Cylicocyclus nassatus]
MMCDRVCLVHYKDSKTYLLFVRDFKDGRGGFMETGRISSILWSHIYNCCFCQQNIVDEFQVPFISFCWIRIVTFPTLDSSIPRKIMPLPLLFVLNLVSGLGGTKLINLPMFTVLRRFSILMTMILEYYILGVNASRAVRISVCLMIAGSVIAALFDLTFDLYGYILIGLNDICTAALGVYTKQKLEAKELGKYGLMFYNSLFMLVPTFILITYTGDTDQAISFMSSARMTKSVWICFFVSCICGFALNYSLVLCTHFNSALTTTCVGPIKNLFVTYVGMFSSGDYVFQLTNFIGINVSVLGSILYTYVTFRTKSLSQRVQSSFVLSKAMRYGILDLHLSRTRRRMRNSFKICRWFSSAAVITDYAMIVDCLYCI